MNRRELLAAAVASAAVGVQVDAESIEVQDSQEVICFVVRTDHWLNQQAIHDIRSCVQRAFDNTKWEEVPLFVMGPGCTFEAVLTPKQATQHTRGQA